MTSALLLTAAFPALLSLLSFYWKRLHPQWDEPVRWGQVALVSGASGLATGSAAVLMSQGANLPVAFSVAIIGWLLGVVIMTDYTTYKIPRGPSRLARYVALIPMTLAAIEQRSWAVIIVVIAMLLIPLLFIHKRYGLW